MDELRAMEVLIVAELKESVSTFFHGCKLNKEEIVTLTSLLEVISYYSFKDEYNLYYEQNKDLIERALDFNVVTSNKLIVTCVQENSDGSADIEVEMDEDTKNNVIGEGVNFIIIKGILGGNTEDYFRWVKLGKQQDHDINRQEKIDSSDTMQSTSSNS